MKTIFTPPDFPTQFQAIGVMRGRLKLEEDMRQVFLVLTDGVKVKARLSGALRGKLQQKPELVDKVTEEELLWKVYPKTTLVSHQSSVNSHLLSY